MGKDFEDRCSSCGLLVSPELMIVKVVNFVERKNRRKVIRSRVTMWYCESCVEKDPDWSVKAYSSPGTKSPALERARSGKIID